MRPINADALIALVQDSTILGDGFKQAFCALVNGEPTIEQERKPGKWIPVINGRGGHECNQCHEYAPSWATGEERLTNFCPNCGVKMEGEDDGFR